MPHELVPWHDVARLLAVDSLDFGGEFYPGQCSIAVKLESGLVAWLPVSRGRIMTSRLLSQDHEVWQQFRSSWEEAGLSPIEAHRAQEPAGLRIVVDAGQDFWGRAQTRIAPQKAKPTKASDVFDLGRTFDEVRWPLL